MPTNRVFLQRLKNLGVDQSGAIAAYAAIGLVVFLGFGALTLDIGHLVSVKGELQKAADAGALAGARALALPMGVADWHWHNGKEMAVKTVQKNFADNRSLADFTDANVETGFWDMSWTSVTAPAHLLGYENPAAHVPTNSQVAAVKVTISKTQGGSGSSAPVATYFSSAMGITSMEPKASAVAMISPPTTIPYSDAWPFALPNTWVTEHWDDDPPLSFTVAADQHSDSGGQWSSFKDQESGATYINGLLLGTNTTDSISIGDQIFIQTGERASIYNTARDNCVGKIRYIAVVRDNFPNGDFSPVLAYVPFEITEVIGSGNNPSVKGKFRPGWIDLHAKGGGGGKYFGDPLPPKLVN